MQKTLGNRQVSKARLTVPALRLTKLGWNSDYISSLVWDARSRVWELFRRLILAGFSSMTAFSRLCCHFAFLLLIIASASLDLRVQLIWFGFLPLPRSFIRHQMLASWSMTFVGPRCAAFCFAASSWSMLYLPGRPLPRNVSVLILFFISFFPVRRCWLVSTAPLHSLMTSRWSWCISLDSLTFLFILIFLLLFLYISGFYSLHSRHPLYSSHSRFSPEFFLLFFYSIHFFFLYIHSYTLVTTAATHWWLPMMWLLFVVSPLHVILELACLSAEGP